jgi:diguanylate cyclase (GGDEF)-like protein
MNESYTSSVAAQAGIVWMKHGTVAGMNLLDGYGLTEFPDPGEIGKLKASPDGTLWCWTGQSLSRYHNSRWQSFGVERVSGAGFIRSNPEQQWIFTSNQSPALHAPIWVVGLDADHALIMLPDQILEFDVLGKTTWVVLSARDLGIGNLTSMVRESKNNIWITGNEGLGRFSLPDRKWQESVKPPAGYTDVREPTEGEDGEVFVSATDQLSRPAVLRMHNLQWQFIYRAESPNVRGWRGVEKTVWIQDGNHLLHLAPSGRATPVERAGPLSGIVLSVNAENPNRFWVGTSQGLAMYNPPLWRTPPETQGLDDLVGAITEDKQGRVWFLSPHSLICLNGERWEFFPLPKNETAWTYISEGLSTLPDNTIAIRTNSTDLLVFDPGRKRFRNVKHPAGRDIRMFVQRSDGLLLVQTIAKDSPSGFALETFDGREFHPFLNPGSSWRIADLRSVLVDAHGVIWVGASDGFGEYKNGTFSRVDASTGFTDTAAFCLKLVAGGRLLAGGRDGLLAYDGQAWHPILHGLDRVRNIATSRDGSVWIASGTGIVRLKGGNQISHGTKEGLPSDVVYRVFEDSRGRVWAGTTRGLSMLHPDADVDPPVTRISAEQNPRDAPPGGRVRLVFSGVDKWKVTPPERLLFSWRIDGGVWSAFASDTSVSLDKLHVGAHTFEARAMDRNGNVDPHPPGYHFSVLPAWYETRGFRFLTVASVLVTGLLLLVTLYKHRLLERKKKIERDRQEILEMVARREPLNDILQRLVCAIAEDQRGAIGAALQHGKGVLQFLAFPAPGVQLIHTRGCWTFGQQGSQRDLAYLGLQPGPTIQILSAKQEILGAMVAIYPRRARQINSGGMILQALSGIASVAIENASLYDQLAHHAHHDLLTGLPNRWSVELELQAAVLEAKENSRPVVLFFLDVDRLKHVNDSLGHRAGDAVLEQVAARLLQSIPYDGMAGRVGGDEFAVLLRLPPDKQQVERAALRVLDAMRTPMPVEGTAFYPSVSIGISMFPQDGEDAITLQRHADLAMYRAKARGKNRCEFFSEDIGDAAAGDVAMESVLRKALDEGGLELYYQVQFDRSGKPVGMEALVRLHHPVFGLVGPSDFIKLSEDTGLIHRVGEWVLQETCRQIRRWQDAGYNPLKVAVNVSALQFCQPSFAKSVGQILDEMQIDPRLIELELTESMIMHGYQESARHMETLRSLGVSIAVDDFGTGYSSLSHLHRLPIDVLKIDRSFVQEVDSTASTWQLVQAIVALAHSLKIAVVAEGVETECQRAALAEIDCDCLQGYVLHRPQPAADIERTFLRPAARFSLPIAG